MDCSRRSVGERRAGGRSVGGGDHLRSPLSQWGKCIYSAVAFLLSRAGARFGGGPTGNGRAKL